MEQNELITMTKKEARRYEIINKLMAGKIDGTEAAKVLGLSVRQTKRLKANVKSSGVKGVIHGSRGKESNHRVDTSIINQAKKYLHEIYFDFNPLLAKEKLFELNKIKLGEETVRQLMINEKLWKPRKKSDQKKHFWRERCDNYGEMEQFDGSYHNWFENRNEKEVGAEQCLLVSVDDASGKLTRVRFEDNEGVIPVFRFWKEYLEANGAPIAIYLDKFSTYKVNHKNAVDNKDMMTQFERVMKQLNVRVIHANTPQAKGRVEKMNGTLQRRLVKEMRLAKINTVAEANIFLSEVFIPKFNRQFAVITKKNSDLHHKVSIEKLAELNKIFSVQSERTINNDYTIRFKSNYYQLKQEQPTNVYKRDKIIVEEHLNGEIKLALRNKYLEYFCLPERPKKEIDVKLIALTRNKAIGFKPPLDHPWRQQYIFKKQPILSATN